MTIQGAYFFIFSFEQEEEAEPQVDKNNKPVSKKQKKEDASKALTSGLNQKKGREKKN